MHEMEVSWLSAGHLLYSPLEKRAAAEIRRKGRAGDPDTPIAAVLELDVGTGARRGTVALEQPIAVSCREHEVLVVSNRRLLDSGEGRPHRIELTREVRQLTRPQLELGLASLECFLTTSNGRASQLDGAELATAGLEPSLGLDESGFAPVELRGASLELRLADVQLHGALAKDPFHFRVELLRPRLAQLQRAGRADELRRPLLEPPAVDGDELGNVVPRVRGREERPQAPAHSGVTVVRPVRPLALVTCLLRHRDRFPPW